MGDICFIVKKLLKVLTICTEGYCVHEKSVSVTGGAKMLDMW